MTSGCLRTRFSAIMASLSSRASRQERQRRAARRLHEPSAAGTPRPACWHRLHAGGGEDARGRGLHIRSRSGRRVASLRGVIVYVGLPHIPLLY